MTNPTGTIAVTDLGWYRYLVTHGAPEEVNFWTPSARSPFRAAQYSPFLFKLKSPDNAICGFGYFARYSALPDWLAWEAFGEGNGCASLAEMRDRISVIRDRIRYRPGGSLQQIGCILVVQPVFFPRDAWVAQPRDWHARTQRYKRYELTGGEGARVWSECLQNAGALRSGEPAASVVAEDESLYGALRVVEPRLGQGCFRVSVLDAYGRACAVTEEHSLPALDAAHIRPFSDSGPNDVRNGLLLRADLHRLLDQGYITVTPDLRIEVSQRLRDDYHNGRCYYPMHGHRIHVPGSVAERPAREFLEWHNERLFLSA
jgi:putative restriction endonuclease